MPSSNPRWGWKPKGLAHARERPYSDDDVLRMANILGVSDTAKIPKLASELQDHGRFYLVAKGDFDESPRPAEIRAALKVLEKRLEAVRSTLDRLDHSARHYLDRTSREEAGPSDEEASDHSALKQSEAELDRLREWTKAASVAIPKRWPPGGARFLFVFGLAQIFQTFTGRKPTRKYSAYEEREYGPFGKFVVAALKPIDHWAVQGIDDVIKDCLKVFPNMG